MIEVKHTTKKAQEIISDLNRSGAYDIFEAYDRPSCYKVSAWQEIVKRANDTAGYNYDLHICGANSSFFSTVYSYTTESGEKVIIKDTASNTYKVVIPAVVEMIPNESTAAELESIA